MLLLMFLLKMWQESRILEYRINKKDIVVKYNAFFILIIPIVCVFLLKIFFCYYAVIK